MPAPKGNQNAKGNKGGSGRPPVYNARCVQTAKTMCAIGATDAQLAEALSVSMSTIRRWQVEHVDFLEACTPTAEQLVAAVKRSLAFSAMGYEHPAVKIMTVSIGNGMSEIVREEYMEHYPPNIAAIKYILNNKSGGEYAERQEIDQRTDATVRVEGGLPDKEPE